MTATILLHSSIVTDFLHGQPQVLARLRSMPPSQIALSALTLLEIQAALLRNPDRTARAEGVFQLLLRSVNVLNFDADDAREAARVHAEVVSAGESIGMGELQLVGQARRRDLVIAYSSAGSGESFDRIKELRSVNWAMPAI